MMPGVPPPQAIDSPLIETDRGDARKAITVATWLASISDVRPSRGQVREERALVGIGRFITVPESAASLSDMTLLNLDPDRLLSTTRAVRKRLDFSRPVPDQLIRECVTMALQAPSGSNVVTMRFVVVRDEKKRQAVGEIYRQVYAQYKASASYPGNPTGEPERDSVQRRVASSADYLGEHMGDAPVLVLGCNEGPDRASALAGLGNILPAMWSFMLAARARGLGTAWTSMHRFREQEVADILGIPYDRVAQAVLAPLAYTKGTDFKPAARPDPDVVIHRDGW